MATPTPGSASKRATGGVSTPSHLNQSSPPRSVPSPIGVRHPAAKTPVNHPTSSSSQGSKTIASTPMVQNLSQGGTSSPNANMLSFSTPSGLGIESATPAGLNIPTPALGAPMMPSMSELGLTTSGGKRNEDEERRAKMRRVLKAIGRPKGRVSEEGIARISRRVGFANDIDAEKLTQEEKERKVGNRPISTAGNTIVIEIDLKNQVPRNVQVLYSVQSKALDEQGAKAGEVLLEDLKAADGVALQAKLDHFATNLERLARIDRLSSSGINGFEALSAIYTGLRRLYEHEKAASKAVLKAKEGNDEGNAEFEVRCRKSGKPVIHEHRKVGLAIEYWGASMPVPGQSLKEAEDARMDIDGETKAVGMSAENDDNDVFSLGIEVEAAPAGLYPSVRVSESWLPDPLQLPSAELTGSIPWQDPPPTFVAADTGGNAMAIDGQQKLPDLRFIAKLNPPLVMPYQTAMNVLAAVGMTQAPLLSMPPSSYAALLLHPAAIASGAAQNLPYSTNAEREVLSLKNDIETTVQHQYALDNVKLDWGYTLEELPFSHPRQLVELLPTLRQWAFMACLLRGTFSREAHIHGTPTAVINGAADGLSSLDDLLAATNGVSDDNRLPISIALATSPIPTLGITCPSGHNESVANISIQILPNAHVAITAQEGILPDDTEDFPTKLQKVAKALEVCGDLGVWVEWLRTLVKV